MSSEAPAPITAGYEPKANAQKPAPDKEHNALADRLEERAASYREGGPSSEHTAALLDESAIAVRALQAAERERDEARAGIEAFCLDFIMAHDGSSEDSDLRSDIFRESVADLARFGARSVLTGEKGT